MGMKGKRIFTFTANTAGRRVYHVAATASYSE